MPCTYSLTIGVADVYSSDEGKNVLFGLKLKRTLFILAIVGQLMLSASAEAASNSDYKAIKARHSAQAPSDRIEPSTNLSKLDPKIAVKVADLASAGNFSKAPESFVLMATSGWINAGGCTYRQAVDNRDVLAGGGSGRRGNARNSCLNSILVSYRGAVDVDLTNQSDPGGLTYSPEVGVNCYPA